MFFIGNIFIYSCVNWESLKNKYYCLFIKVVILNVVGILSKVERGIGLLNI